MTNDDQEKTFLARVKDLALSLFHDHSESMDKSWDEFADNTFFNREGEGEALKRKLKECLGTNKNLVIVGDAGVGKTALIKKTLHLLKKGNNNLRILPYYFNIRKNPNETIDDILKSLSFYLLRILELFKQKPSAAFFADLEEHNPKIAFQKIVRLLRSITIDDVNKRYPILIIDDIDYLENKYLKPLLDSLSILFDLNQICIVWACRPPAFYEVEYNIRSRVKLSFLGINPYIVHSIKDIRGLIVSRLWPILDNKQCNTDIVRLKQVHESTPNSKNFKINLLSKIKKQFPEFKIKLNEVPYPLRYRQENFILECSNGDIRVIFEMLYRIVEYTELKKYKLDKNKCMDIDRLTFLGILGMTDNHKNPVMPYEENELWKIIDLFEILNTDHSSPLLVNVLQWVAQFNFFDENYYQLMSEFGFSKSIAFEGVMKCLDYRLIEPEAIKIGQFPLLLEIEDSHTTKMILTAKGSFYIKELIKWPEYIFSNKTRKKDYDCVLKKCYQYRLYYDIVELAGNYLMLEKMIFDISAPFLANKGLPKPGYLEIPFKIFYDDFKEIYGQSYVSVRALPNNHFISHDYLSEEYFMDAICNLVVRDSNKEEHALIIEKKKILFKRAKINQLIKTYDIEMPNASRICYERILENSLEWPWRNKVTSQEWGKNNISGKIISMAKEKRLI